MESCWLIISLIMILLLIKKLMKYLLVSDLFPRYTTETNETPSQLHNYSNVFILYVFIL